MELFTISKDDQYEIGGIKYFKFKHPEEGVYTIDVYVAIYKNSKVVLNDLAKLLGIKGRGSLTKRDLCPKIIARIRFEH